jgi:hypothetical protein
MRSTTTVTVCGCFAEVTSPTRVRRRDRRHEWAGASWAEPCATWARRSGRARLTAGAAGFGVAAAVVFAAVVFFCAGAFAAVAFFGAAAAFSVVFLGAADFATVFFSAAAVDLLFCDAGA